MRKATFVRLKDLELKPSVEVPLQGYKGICADTVENPELTMSHVFIPPGGRNQRHYHVNCDAGMHILKGRLKYFIGPDHEIEEVILEEGDFAFIPKGVIHGFQNLSDTETAEIVAAKPNVRDFDEDGNIFVETPWV